MNYEPRQYVGYVNGAVSTVALRNPGQRDITHFEDTGDVPLTGVIRTVQGAKYNVNGTWRAASTPGVTRAVILCRGSTMKEANDRANGLYDLAGTSGTLYGVEYVGSTVSTHTCSVVVGPVRPLTMFDRVGAAPSRAHSIQVELVFERMGDWS